MNRLENIINHQKENCQDKLSGKELNKIIKIILYRVGINDDQEIKVLKPIIKQMWRAA